jgi:hypothetical protein
LAKWRFLADPADELPVAQLTIAPPQNKATLTRVEAEADVKYLFLLFKHGYSGYGFYNENNNWERAQEAILQDLAKQETISGNDLASRISKQLAFINDGHMAIGNQKFFQHQDYWHWDGMDFFKEGERFWNWGAGGKQWLEAVNGKPPAAWLKYALNSQGDPVYQLGTLSPQKPDDFTLEISRADGKRAQQTGFWLRAAFTSDGAAYTRVVQDGIPVIVNRTLSGSATALKSFQDDAPQLRKEPVVVLDLRGNGGGSSSIAENWVRNFSGVNPKSPYISTELGTRTTFIGKLNVMATWPDMTSSIDYKSLVAQLDSGARKRGWSDFRVPQYAVVPNPNQLLIVLTDSRICSSGEWFLGVLKQLENVVFVGENSMGCRPFGDLTIYRLPNSGLQVRLTNKLFLEPDLASTQGIGYLPDLWVPASKALPYTLAAIKRGWLQPK